MPEAVDISSLLMLRSLQPPGKPDRVASIASRFLEETDERLADIDRALGAGDAPALERAAHGLKGISGTVGANAMYDLARRLEELARAGRLTGAAELQTALQAAFAGARPIFEELRGQT